MSTLSCCSREGAARRLQQNLGKLIHPPGEVEQRVSWAESFTVPGQNPENEKIQLTTKFLRRGNKKVGLTVGVLQVK